MSDVLVLIPARLAATRLPGKPLLDIHGVPMIVHVVRRAQAARIGEVVVATDSEPVLAAVEKAGGRAVMTRVDHPSGSDRIYEALTEIDPERRFRTIVNVQGDLPTIDPDDIKAALGPLRDPAVDIATLAAPIETFDDWQNPNIVKVTGKEVGKNTFSARLFARDLSPAIWESQIQSKGREFIPTPGHVYAFARPVFYHHIGLYAYRRAALVKFVGLPPSENEKREKLEQLRALDAGMRIDVAVVNSVPLGVDAPDDLEKARQILRDLA